MRRLRWIVAPLPFVLSLGLAGACTQKPVAIGLSMVAPQGVLDNATGVELRVISEGGKCDTETGEVSGEVDEDSVETFGLEQTGCAAGSSWCKDIKVVQSDDEKIFQVTATGAGGIIAGGCAEVVVDQDPLDVSIGVVPVFDPPCCNDGTVQYGEQCDNGAPGTLDCAGNASDGAACSTIAEDPVCLCDCLAKEIILSAPGTTVPLTNELNSKFDPAFAFAGGAALGGIPSSLRAVYTDTSGGAIKVNLRVLDADLMPVPDLLGQQIRLPRDCENLENTAGDAFAQGQPDIARLNDDSLLVAYTDNSSGTQFEIRVVLQNAWACNDASVPAPATCPACGAPPCDSDCPATKLGTVGSGDAEAPAVASGQSDRALVVWRNGQSLRGRVWVGGADSDCNTCLPAGEEITFGNDIIGDASTTGHNGAYLVAYAEAGNVFVRAVSLDGLVDPAVQVNIAGGNNDQPAIAALPDGRFAVVWRNADTGQILFQRFDDGGNPIGGDQDQPLSKNSPEAGQPAIAASTTTGTFWAAVWITTEGTAWARYIDAEGTFLRNHVDRTLDDFMASHPAIVGQRQTPDVAIGGNGYVAFGWADAAPDPVDGAQGQGIRVRRFPAPE